MSSKKHCDVCDVVINEKISGGEITRTGFANRISESMELCGPHYVAAQRVLSTWRDFEIGGMVTWPTQRVSR